MGPIWRITHIDMDRSGVYEWQVTGRSHWAPTTKVKHDPVKICLFTQRFNWIVRHSMINWRWICSASVGQSLHPVDALNRWLADKERAAVDRDKFMPTAGRNLKRIVLRLPAKRNDLASSLTSSTHMGVVITMQMTFHSGSNRFLVNGGSCRGNAMVGGLKNRFTRSLTQVISANDTDKMKESLEPFTQFWNFCMWSCNRHIALYHPLLVSSYPELLQLK